MFRNHIVVVFFSILAMPVAQAQVVTAEQRAELRARIESYGQCQASCSEDLLSLMLDKGSADALAVIGLSKGGKSKPLTGLTGKLSFYVVARKIWTDGKQVIDTYGVCANKCDAMYADIVELGRSGLLGPITKSKPIPDEWFNNENVRKIWDKYIKPLDPQDLPSHFHNEKRWAEIMNTA